MNTDTTDYGVVGHIEHNPDPFYAPNNWFYTVDYATADGERNLDLDSFDYGNVETREFAEECVADAIARYRDSAR